MERWQIYYKYPYPYIVQLLAGCRQAARGLVAATQLLPGIHWKGIKLTNGGRGARSIRLARGWVEVTLLPTTILCSLRFQPIRYEFILATGHIP